MMATMSLSTKATFIFLEKLLINHARYIFLQIGFKEKRLHAFVSDDRSFERRHG